MKRILYVIRTRPILCVSLPTFLALAWWAWCNGYSVASGYMIGCATCAVFDFADEAIGANP